MTRSGAGSQTKEAVTAVLIALWLHLALFGLFVLLLFWQVLGAILIPQEKQEVAFEEMTELAFSLEDAPVFEELPADELTPAEEEVVEVEEKTQAPVMSEPQFVRTAPDQEAGRPEETDLIGDRDTLAQSDMVPEPGAEDLAALAGEVERAAPQSFDEKFQEGTNEGGGGRMAGPATGEGEGELSAEAVAEQEAQMAQEKVEARKAVAEVAGEAEGSEEAAEAMASEAEEFLEPEMAEEALPEARKEEGEGELAMAEAAQEKKEKKEAKEVEERKKQEEAEEREKREQEMARQAGGGGEFRSEARKTLVMGSLDATGRASLNVKNTALGRYQKAMFREIERGWQEGNFQFRSHLVPGSVSTRFLVDENGKISGQRRIEMRGASQMQWGLILRALEGAKIPPMPKEVRDELNGQELELSITFNY
ncbi:MAG: hypothetical protein ACQKBY_05010 [Verrucomicrobiales bacterium]